MAGAAFGLPRDTARAYRLNERQERHYLEWAEPFAEAIGGRVGFADETIYHLWHGALERRVYGHRYHGFERFDFGPFESVHDEPGTVLDGDDDGEEWRGATGIAGFHHGHPGGPVGVPCTLPLSEGFAVALARLSAGD